MHVPEITVYHANSTTSYIKGKKPFFLEDKLIIYLELISTLYFHFYILIGEHTFCAWNRQTKKSINRK